MPHKKMGRPTDSPKIYDVKTRLDEPTMQILQGYCQATGRNRAEAIRDGIRLLRSPEKK